MAMFRKLLCLILLLTGDLLVVLPFLASLPWMPTGGGLDRLLPIAPFLVSVLWLGCVAREGLYVRRNRLPAEVRHLARASILALLMLFSLAELELLPATPAPGLVVAAAGIMVGLTLVRLVLKPILFRMGLWRKEVVLVGAGTTGRRLIDALADDRFTGLEVVAALDDDPALHGVEIRGVRVSGPLDDLEAVIGANRRPSDPPLAARRDLLIAIPALPRERLQALIKRAEGRVESIRFVPDLLGLSTLGVELESLRGTPAIRLKQNLMKPWNAAFKRALDLGLASILMCFLVPMGLVLALFIRLETPGAPILVQPRLGRKGRLFNCFKFRTMFVDADHRLELALSGDPALKLEWEAFAKLKARDPRVTPLGRWLRRFSLDELPQLWNVLRGEMSLIGPRPYLPREVERIGETLPVIGVARPGLTGLWQVSGRNELTFQERLALDEYYVRNWTVGMDLWILLRTVGAMLSGRGAY